MPDASQRKRCASAWFFAGNLAARVPCDAVGARLRIGELLVSASVITQEQLDHALTIPRPPGQRLGDLLVQDGLVNETQLTQTLSQQLSVPWVSLYHVDFSRQLLNFVPREVADKFCLVPIFVRRVKKQGETLYVAMDDPTNEVALAEVAQHAGLPVRPMIASPSDIRSAIRVYYGDPAPPASTASVPPPSAASPSVPPPSTLDASPPPQRAASPSVPPPPPGAAAAKAPPPPVRPAAGTPSSPPAPMSRPDPAGDGSPRSAPSGDSPDAAPELEAREIVPKPRRSGVPMIALTLLDGSTIHLPAKKRAEAPASDAFTAGDVIRALLAMSQGGEAKQVLGQELRWESVLAATLAVLLRKGLIADWEFVDEYRKVLKRKQP